jgi:carboxypeptidase PM20D1
MGRLAIAVLVLVLAVLAGFIGYRTVTYVAAPSPAEIAAPDLLAYPLDAGAAAAHLGQAIRFRTVSLTGAPDDDPAQFTQFHAWLAATYPAFHAAAKLETINALSLIYTWEGSDPAQPPILLLAHQDVVPVPPDTIAHWQADPFGGVLRDGVVWGRGAIDDKSSIIGLMEAAEMLARAGRRPTRTIIFAFGHDEELGGEQGASAMAALLARRGVRAWFALDEGLLAVAEHPLTGGPAALIGISEKGSGSLRVTAMSTLAEAVTAIHAMPIRRSISGGVAEDMMRALSPHMSLGTRVALANEWLFAPVLRARLADNRAAQALLGTTVAPTMINGGVRTNVLPGEATAFINLRIHPRDSADGLLAAARAAVADLEGVSVEWAEEPREASPVSRADSSSYALVAALSRAALPDAPVAPGLVLAGTDSRLYSDVAENVYRYQPLLLATDDLETIHGLNEHVSVENFERLIRFYAGLMDAGAMQ